MSVRIVSDGDPGGGTPPLQHDPIESAWNVLYASFPRCNPIKPVGDGFPVPRLPCVKEVFWQRINLHLYSFVPDIAIDSTKVRWVKM